ncbi:hypothetical protein BURPS1655_D1704 [Burkholderia pseudomallei 1655]|nr:hypothetical protein BURPS1655_D1704 [Burkholderia pseudomallei 1655]
MIRRRISSFDQPFRLWFVNRPGFRASSYIQGTSKNRADAGMMPLTPKA